MKSALKFAFLNLTALILLATMTTARNDKWEVIGPGGGGAMFIPTISPHDAKDVLIACDMTGAYLSHDGGSSWRMFNLGGVVRAFEFDPSDPKVIYARTSILWRSEDRGNTWKLVYPDASQIERVTMADDHAEQEIVKRGDAPGELTAFAVDAADSSTLFATLEKNGARGFFESHDRGKSWKKTSDLRDRVHKLYVDPDSPRQDRTLYAIGASWVAVREKGAWRRGATPKGVSSFIDVSLGFPQGGAKALVYAVTEKQLYLSSDGGASWREASLPGLTPLLRAVATSLRHPEVTYLSFTRLRMGLTWYWGVLKTTDGGNHWEVSWKEDKNPTANLRDAWITQRFGTGWGENPLSLGVSPVDPSVAYGTDFGRAFRTTDGGKHWNAVYSNRQPDGTFTTTGLDVTTNYGVHFDPFDKKRMFISYTDIGLFASENGGRTWSSATKGVPEPWVNTTYWVEFDPAVRGRMWGVMSGIHDLPRPKMWRRQQPSKFNGGVCLSQDGGKTWVRTTDGMPETAATHILLDPTSPPSARVLYVAGFGRGVFKSIDGGTHWVLKNNGITENEPFAWRITRDPKGLLYLVIARRSDDGSIGNSGDGALYRSADGAEHWKRIALPKGVNGPNGLAVDPKDPQRLYLAAWGRNTSSGAVNGGIYLSNDSGVNWRNVLSKDQHVYDVTVDSSDPKTLYVCGFESSAWRSIDSGATWTRLRGYNFKWGHRVIPDPYDPSRIYINTFGGSVWHGPAEGDRSATEDVVTPALGYTR